VVLNIGFEYFAAFAAQLMPTTSLSGNYFLAAQLMPTTSLSGNYFLAASRYRLSISIIEPT
jgi:hypothetical protein